MPESKYEVSLEQCLLETELASKLRNAGRIERSSLYGEVYATYAAAFPAALHPADEQTVGYELAFARRFVKPGMIVAEVGPGSGEFAKAIAPHCKRIYGIDVAELCSAETRPPNFAYAQTDGIAISLPDASVDIVISNQLMEHLHPEDAADQLQEILRIVRPGGLYICMTPNRLHGPHDSSARFAEVPCPIVDGTFVANGLHLKEYTNQELSELFLRVRFSTVRHFAGARGRYIEVPAVAMRQIEYWTRRIPARFRKRSRLLRAALGVRIVARK